MRTKVLLFMCAAILSGTGYALNADPDKVLTADPNVFNSSFEVPVIPAVDARDPAVYDWWEAATGNLDTRTATRRYNTGGWQRGAGQGAQFAHIVGSGCCIYQAVASFTPNTMYEVTFWLGKRDQNGPSGLVELWAGGDPHLLYDDNNSGRLSVDFPLALSGATLVDAESFDYSDLGSGEWSPGVTTFYLETGTSHTTSDPLYLVISRGADGGQLGVDDVFMGFTTSAVLINPANGATGLPVTTDDDTATADTTLEWIAPSAYTPVGYDVYIGKAEPNLLVADYGMTKLAALTTATHTDPSPSGDLDFATPYYWVVDTHEPNTVGTILHQSVGTFTTVSAAPVVDITPNGARTWLGQPIAVPATVVDPDGQSFTTAYTVTGPAEYIGDPNLFLSDITTDVAEPNAVFTVTGTDPNLIGNYTITLTATDAATLTGTDTMWVQVTETPCEARIENGGGLSPFDMNDDCVIDLDDALRWFEAWLDNRVPSGPTVYNP